MNRTPLTSILLVLLATGPLLAQPGRGGGFRGGGQGRGPGHGHGQDQRHSDDHDVFQFLLTNHKKINRTVKQLDDGVETLTESVDAEIAAKIKEHVKWMEYRIENANPIRMRDPLFAEIFKHAEKIKMQREETANGVRVIETSDDPYVVKLIQAHAQVVSGFVKRGFAEAMKNHAIPGDQATEAREHVHPVIKKYGNVVSLPDAVQQPRDGSKICVDLTDAGSDPGKLSPAIEKVARFVNIYAGAGAKPASVRIAVVLHGDATLAALDADAYEARFKTQGNPNLDCLHELHQAGVELYVCGQSLISKKATPEQVVVFIDVAVSGLTSLVNLQADGYRYLPLLK